MHLYFRLHLESLSGYFIRWIFDSSHTKAASLKLKMISTNVFTFENCYSENFVKNENHANHLADGLVNMINGIEQTRQNSILLSWVNLSESIFVL